jgi:hypothetical protein
MQRVNGEHAADAAEVISHLLKTGREQFFLISGPAESCASKIRLQSWLKEISAADKQVCSIYEGDRQAKSGYLAVREAVELKNQDPTLNRPFKQTRIPVKLNIRQSSGTKPDKGYNRKEIQQLLRKIEAQLP